MTSKTQTDKEQKDRNENIDTVLSPEQRERLQRGAKRFFSNSLSVVGLVIVLGVVLLAVLAPVVAPYPQDAGKVTNFDESFEQPSFTHLFGTDEIGRDIFSRVLFGYRYSLILVTAVLGIGVPIGVTLGLLAGYYGGWVETIIMRLTDTFLALPPLVMALAITAALAPTLTNAMLAIATLWWTWYARLVKGVAESVSNEPYVHVAQLFGASTPHILLREILPNCLSTILVKITLDAGIVILIGAGLSFIGVGVQPPQPGLGTMVSQGTEYLPNEWWYSVLPGLSILVLVTGFNMLGDGLRDFFDVEVQS